MSEAASFSPCRLTGFGLVAPHVDRLARFYEEVFGSCFEASGNLDGSESERLLGVPGTTRYITFGLGAERIDLFQFQRPGRPYPPESSACDLLFQHFAIVVSDMGLAFEHLCAASGWTPITQGGPQHLPQSSGGVTAFKFRDPAGHPLELLEFPPDNIPEKWRGRSSVVFLGIDHSAIAVRDTATSERFYRRLGFLPSARSVNQGLEQEKLDGVRGAVVEVTGLSCGGDGPHIELLCYRDIARSTSAVSASDDAAATRLELDLQASAVPESQNAQLLDPDGHHLIVRNGDFPCWRQ
jgi:catechol 2,3-dioxygenase-like lactoylglutathione lyase family enzyme